MATGQSEELYHMNYTHIEKASALFTRMYNIWECKRISGSIPFIYIYFLYNEPCCPSKSFF